MSSTTFSIFEEDSQNGIIRKFTLPIDKNCVWMKIYVWTKYEIGLVEECNILNSLLVKHRAEGYNVFKICMDNLSFPEKAFVFLKKKKKKKSTELDFLVETQRSIDKNGSMTWHVYHNNFVLLQR